MFRRLLLHVPLLALVSGPALADDLPRPPMWSGFYAGLNAGYGWGTSSRVATTALPLVDNLAGDPFWGTPFGFAAAASSGVAKLDQSGFVRGGQLGYNYRLGPAFVAGLEADFQGAGIRGEGGHAGFSQVGPDLSGAVDTAYGAGAVTAAVDWIGTLRGRLGYLATPTVLLYATGGLAYGGVRASATHDLGFSDDTPTIYPTFGGRGGSSGARVGWTAGGGAEWAFAPQWSIRAEALYYDLGAVSVASSPVGAVDPDGLNLAAGAPGALLFASGPTTRVRFDGVIARAGVSYHFDSDASASAAAPQDSPPPTWSGFYLGSSAGYGWSAASAATRALPLVDNLASDPFWGTPYGFTAAASSGAAAVDRAGFVGGGQIGYNHRWSPAFVVGVEADIQGAAIHGAGGYVGAAQFGPDASGLTNTAYGAGIVTTEVDWIGTIRGRLGFLATPSVLVYGTGGLAFGEVRAKVAHSLGFADSAPTIFPTLAGQGRYSGVEVGWTAGGGVEWAFAPEWSVKAEALYYDLGWTRVSSSPVGALDPDGLNLSAGAPGALLFANGPETRVRFDGVIARVGLNHKIDVGAWLALAGL
jgi:outer membrane immunogenic protein